MPVVESRRWWVRLAGGVGSADDVVAPVLSVAPPVAAVPSGAVSGLGGGLLSWLGLGDSASVVRGRVWVGRWGGRCWGLCAVMVLVVR